jgi:putative ABC transport system permease protein
MWQDLRIAVRTLRQSPGFTLAAVVALALGIGANTAVFSVADGLLFRPLLLDHMERLVTVAGTKNGMLAGDVSVSPADFYGIANGVRSLESVTAWHYERWNVTGENNPEVLRGAMVIPNFFETLGLPMAVGRGFRGEEPVPPVVISQALWQRRFGGSSSILGRTLRLNGVPHEIVGVAAPGAQMPPSAEAWVPIEETPAFRNRWDDFYLKPIGRLREGATRDGLNAELRLITSRFAGEHPATHTERKLEAWQLAEFVSGYLTGSYTRLSLIAVSFLLLIACANVANLLFARVSGRSREIALRQALGASRWTIVRQLLLESLLLGLGGLAVSFLFSLWGVDLLKASMPAAVEKWLPGWQRIGVNRAAVLYGALMALGASLVAGVAPAWIGSRSESLLDSLREGGRSLSGGGVGRHQVRRLLVIAQVTVSLVLIIGGALMYRGALALFADGPGRDRARILTAQIGLEGQRFADEAKRVAMQDRMVERLRQIRGVDGVTIVQHLPYGYGSSVLPLRIEGETLRTGEKRSAQQQAVGAGYLEMLGIALQRGRSIEETDGRETRRVAVISEKTARLYFGGRDPLGQRLRMGDGEWVTVVGVVADVLHDWTQRVPTPTVYVPYRQTSPVGFSLLLHSADRASGDVAGDLRAAMLTVDSELPLQDVASLERVVGEQLAGMGYIAGMLAGAAILSLLLAAIGIYSLMSYVVSERTREVGIRMALGATKADVMKLIVGQGFRTLAVGLAIGTVCALAVSKLLGGLVYGVSEFDGAALFGGVTVLAVAGLLASAVPARWASSVDPMVVLRRE